MVGKRVKIAIDLILNSAIEEWQKQGGGETHLEPPSVRKGCWRIGTQCPLITERSVLLSSRYLHAYGPLFLLGYEHERDEHHG